MLQHILHFFTVVHRRVINIANYLPTGKKKTLKIENADLLHPKSQRVQITKIVPISPDTKVFTLRSETGQALAHFAAGQYVSVRHKNTTRPYSLVSSPKQATKGIYRIAVKRVPGGEVSNYFFSLAKVGQTLELSGPMGEFTYTPIRDGKNVLAIAGGSGITPFISMCQSILEGSSVFDLTILYGSVSRKDILFYHNLKKWTQQSNKIHVVHVLSGEDENRRNFGCDGADENHQENEFAQGFITRDLIEMYLQEDCSIFVCGPEAMVSHIKRESAHLTTAPKNIRYEIMNVYRNRHLQTSYPLTLRWHGQIVETICHSDEPLIKAIEKSNLPIQTACRSGICGLCHTKVVSGSYYVAEEQDGRRCADKTYNYIHPCVTYPDSAMVLELS
ncbi:MAG: FAD-binding oxidoreductase [Lachnospiraceae bacterium]